ncbi:MAG TPA: hypothetical protein VGQ83_29035 [Polyangia bacterium]|jgi:hypothetical protein
MRMRPAQAAGGLLILLALWLSGCYMGTGAAAAQDGGGGGPGTDGAPVVGPATGLPCDVAQAMQPCLGCHVPGGSGPMALVTYEDLTRATPSNAAKSAAEQSVARMQDPQAPMPPPPAAPAPAAAIAAVQAWIQAGYPRGSCDNGDAGVPDPAFTAAPTCTSGAYTGFGEDIGALMHPGRACNACHGSGGGPIFSIAGTLYPTGHEYNDCNGAGQAGAQVVITGADGRVLTLTPNTNGTFTSYGVIALPYHAKVVAGGRERAMSAAQQSGDCNSCHTQAGASGAPGRIVVP